MSSEPSPTRNACLATSAATLVALLSMATMISVTPGVESMPREGRTTLSDTQSMRAMMGAVAAAAREMLDGEQLDYSMAMSPMRISSQEAPQTITIARFEAESRSDRRLSPHLLDLPPPGC